jgi:hypothetical protein
MTNPGFFGPRRAAQPSVPRGDVLGTYDSYPEAQAVVERLAQHEEFPIDSLSILGNDLKTVERVTGRLSYPRAALAGAASGLWFGLFVGLFFLLTGGGLQLLIVGMLIGAAFGLLFGVISYAVTRRQRDFASQSQVLASNYQVIVNPELTVRAQQLLAQGPPPQQ